MVLSPKSAARASNIFKKADLGNVTRVRRAMELSEALALAPCLSLPKIWSTPAELEAAYLFLRKPSTGFAALMDAVQQETRERALKEMSVLILHDTTDVTCPSASPDEVGFLQTGQAGFYVHHALCVSGDGNRPLGVLWSELWGRPQRSGRGGRNLSGPELAKLEYRESDRWLEGVTEAQLWSEGCQQVIHVMDREGDFYRLYEHLLDLDADFVIRLRHNRSTEDGVISECLARQPITVQRLVQLSARKQKTMPSHTHQGRPARKANLVVRCAELTFRPPNHMKKDSDDVTLNVLQVLEEHPPKGQKPVSWVIATTLPIKTVAQIERVIDIYRARWLIEEFHKALKTGCMLEKRQLESFESITTLLALCYPIACELLRVRSRAREPGLAAGDVLRKTLLDCLRAHPKARPLPKHPTAEEALGVIAGLGGHIKHNGPPGWQTLAAGYMALLSFEQGWLAALRTAAN